MTTAKIRRPVSSPYSSGVVTPPASLAEVDRPLRPEGPVFSVSTSRMLKKSASGVLASLRGSTYRSVRLASSLAAALLDGLFEHPAAI